MRRLGPRLKNGGGEYSMRLTSSLRAASTGERAMPSSKKHAAPRRSGLEVAVDDTGDGRSPALVAGEDAAELVHLAPAPCPNRAPRRSADRRQRSPAARSLPSAGGRCRAAARRRRSAPCLSRRCPRPSSGGVCSRADLTALTMLFSGSVSASRISLLEMVKLRGMPSARLRPLTSFSRTSLPGKAEPISFLISSAVVSPISMP